MIKSYNDWKVQNHVTKQFNEVALPLLLEWSFWNPLGGRGMGDAEGEQMERLGQMLGFNKSWWNVLARDPRHAGDAFLGSLKKIMGGQEDPKQKAEKAGELMVKNFRRIKGNSPFKQAFDKASQMKRTVNRNPNLPSKDLDHEEIHQLMIVLMNAHSKGNVPWKDLNDLWRGITGAIDPNTGNRIDQSYQAAKQQDINTPIHLMRTFFGIGGGSVFTEPSNWDELGNKASYQLKQIDPGEYNNLYNQKMGTGGAAGGGGNNTNANANRNAGGNAPVAQAAPMDYTQMSGHLQQVLQQVQQDPQAGASALQQFIQMLAGMGGGTATPAANNAGAPKKKNNNTAVNTVTT